MRSTVADLFAIILSVAAVLAATFFVVGAPRADQYVLLAFDAGAIALGVGSGWYARTRQGLTAWGVALSAAFGTGFALSVAITAADMIERKQYILFALATLAVFIAVRVNWRYYGKRREQSAQDSV